MLYSCYVTQLDVPSRQTTPTRHIWVLGSSFRCLDKEDKRPQNEVYWGVGVSASGSWGVLGAVLSPLKVILETLVHGTILYKSPTAQLPVFCTVVK